jgi:hypothetical protein
MFDCSARHSLQRTSFRAAQGGHEMSSPARALCSSPNTDALIREVIEKEYVFLLKVATKKLRNPEFSHDAVRDAFICAWQARHQYEGTGKGADMDDKDPHQRVLRYDPQAGVPHCWTRRLN